MRGCARPECLQQVRGWFVALPMRMGKVRVDRLLRAHCWREQSHARCSLFSCRIPGE